MCLLPEHENKKKGNSFLSIFLSQVFASDNVSIDSCIHQSRKFIVW